MLAHSYRLASTVANLPQRAAMTRCRWFLTWRIHINCMEVCRRRSDVWLLLWMDCIGWLGFTGVQQFRSSHCNRLVRMTVSAACHKLPATEFGMADFSVRCNTVTSADYARSYPRTTYVQGWKKIMI